MEMAWYWGLIIGILALIGGAVIGFLVARKLMKDQLEKNPPINEKAIREMYKSVGRTPSEAQVRQTMNNIRNANKNTPKKK